MLGKTLFVGAGAMGGAILRGAIQSGLLTKETTYVVVKSDIHATELTEELGVTVSTSIPELSTVDTIIWALKPQVLPTILQQVQGITPETVCISVAAGITLESLETLVPQAIWYRTMPNTPVAVGAGLTAIAGGSKATVNTTEQVVELFAAIGETVVVTEADLDRLSAISGAGPGYAFVIMDALADAGVRIGLPRKVAIKAAAQTLYGAGLMALQTSAHPAVLRDQVTSPGGTTIAGIAAMEKGGLRSAIQDGVVACYERSLELGKK